MIVESMISDMKIQLTRIRCLFFQGLMAGLLFICASGCSEELSVQTEEGKKLEAFTGGHTRLAWVQAQGMGFDTYAFGKNLMLMGYDSCDGKGARPLLKEVGNYFKPLLTPDGKGVVVSSRQGTDLRLIDFDSGKSRSLGDGVAVALWKDGEEVWVYALAGIGFENKYLSTKNLYRFPLSSPDKRELVWKKTHLSWSNLDISRDGSVIGGLFPWPHAAILDLEKKNLKRYGRGCWTALSPDNSKILWIFDGLHRNLSFFDTLSGEEWITNINGAEGIDGFEVYHPRWSNHFQYFVMTGPYKEGEGGNKINGGGKAVEIYIGKFSEDLHQVDGWFRLTSNALADFYPDVWIEGGEKVSRKKNDEKVLAQEKADASGGWPLSENILLFAWEGMNTDNQLPEVSPLGFRQIEVNPLGKARFNRFFEMDLQGDGFKADAAGVLPHIQKKNDFGLGFFYTPGTGDGDILKYGGEKNNYLLFSKKGQRLLFSIDVQGRKIVEAEVEDGVHLHSPGFFYLSCSGGQLDLYKNGVKIFSGKRDKSFLSGWKESGLYFGRSNQEGEGVHGSLSHVSIHGAPLDELQINGIWQFLRQELNKRDDIPAVHITGTLVEQSVVPAPDTLGAYSRALVVNRYRVDKRIAGEYENEEILVAQWAVMDRKILREAERFTPGSKREMKLELFENHPELEGERLMMDIFDPDLDLYYETTGRFR